MVPLNNNEPGDFNRRSTEDEMPDTNNGINRQSSTENSDDTNSNQHQPAPQPADPTAQTSAQNTTNNPANQPQQGLPNQPNAEFQIVFGEPLPQGIFDLFRGSDRGESILQPIPPGQGNTNFMNGIPPREQRPHFDEVPGPGATNTQPIMQREFVHLIHGPFGPGEFPPGETNDDTPLTADEVRDHTVSSVLRNGPGRNRPRGGIIFVSIRDDDMTQKASDAALRSLVPIPLSSIAEGERECTICYEPLVEPPKPTPQEEAPSQTVPSEEEVAQPHAQAQPSSDEAQVNQNNNDREHQIDMNDHSPLAMPHCKHVFGASCLRKWLESNCSCPLCRDALESDPRPNMLDPAHLSFILSRLYEQRMNSLREAMNNPPDAPQDTPAPEANSAPSPADAPPPPRIPGTLPGRSVFRRLYDRIHQTIAANRAASQNSANQQPQTPGQPQGQQEPQPQAQGAPDGGNLDAEMEFHNEIRNRLAEFGNNPEARPQLHVFPLNQEGNQQPQPNFGEDLEFILRAVHAAYDSAFRHRQFHIDNPEAHIPPPFGQPVNFNPTAAAPTNPVDNIGNVDFVELRRRQNEEMRRVLAEAMNPQDTPQNEPADQSQNSNANSSSNSGSEEQQNPRSGPNRRNPDRRHPYR